MIELEINGIYEFGLVRDYDEDEDGYLEPTDSEIEAEVLETLKFIIVEDFDLDPDDLISFDYEVSYKSEDDDYIEYNVTFMNVMMKDEDE